MTKEPTHLRREFYGRSSQTRGRTSIKVIKLLSTVAHLGDFCNFKTEICSTCLNIKIYLMILLNPKNEFHSSSPYNSRQLRNILKKIVFFCFLLLDLRNTIGSLRSPRSSQMFISSSFLSLLSGPNTHFHHLLHAHRRQPSMPITSLMCSLVSTSLCSVYPI